MSLSPIEEAHGRRIGSVEFVSPDEIKVSLDFDAPDNIALNTGSPRSFPRVNNYLLIPGEEGFIVGQVEWLAIERSPFPKRKGLQDFGLIDLPFSHRKLSLNPVGTLAQSDYSSTTLDNDDNVSFTLKRGVYSFPTIGDPVLLPTTQQLRNIVESGENRRVLIGHAPLAGNAEVKIDPDRLFGRHLAVLGNTGSGKSCTVAGLIQWSLEEAKKSAGKQPNARFIILDPNGEYTRAFEDKKEAFNTKIYKGNDTQQLKVPLWFWNSEEWCSFMQASGRSQKPLLRRALREVRGGVDPLAEHSDENAIKQKMRRYLSSQLITIQKDLRSNSIKTEETKFGYRLKAIKEDLIEKKDEVADCTQEIQIIINKIDAALDATFNIFQNKAGEMVEFYRAFTNQQINEITTSFHEAVNKIGGIIYHEGPGENTPLIFKGSDFADHLEILAEQEGVSQFIDTLIIRIRTMLADSQMRNIVGDSEEVSLDDWLEDYIGSQDGKSAVTIIDLSLVSSDIIHVVTAVISRMIFEALQRYRISHIDSKTLPTVLVMEEAHTFIRRYKDDAEETSAAGTCCRVFEKIAREGRKFGLGLVLSSQRPSELSSTVLSQCNSFILHRISNDKDQEAVNKLLPDHLRGILRELPVLPTRYAFLLGWASELPLLTQIRELPILQQPQSDDPDFWAVWTGKDAKGNAVTRNVDWKVLAENWQVNSSKSEKLIDTNSESKKKTASGKPTTKEKTTKKKS